MILPLVAKSEVTVPTVVDDVLRTVLPVTVKVVADALLRTVRPVEVRLVVEASLAEREYVVRTEADAAVGVL